MLAPRRADIPFLAIAITFLAALAQATAHRAPAWLATLIEQSAAIRDLIETDDAKAFLDAAQALPDPGPRTVHIAPDRATVLTDDQAANLPQDVRKTYTTRTHDQAFFYNTAFGIPALYARPLDLAAKARLGPDKNTLHNARVLDFGYGMIAQGRMLATIGCDVHATDVWPLLPALYSQPQDTGPIPASSPSRQGRLTLHHGRWPADPTLAAAVGQGFDIFISKNVLKRGYIHPEQPADPAKLITLGVDDQDFVRAIHRALKPGGVAIIYNISPAQNPPQRDGKPLPYLPHADGRTPFPRDMIERAGFEVLAFDQDDTPIIHTMWKRLGLVKPGDAPLDGALFAQYTLLRRRD